MKKNKYKIGVILGLFIVTVFAYVLTNTVFGEDGEDETENYVSRIKQEVKDREEEMDSEERNVGDDIEKEKDEVENETENEEEKMVNRVKKEKKEAEERAENLQEKAREYKNKKDDENEISDVEVEIQPKNVVDDKVKNVGLRIKTKKDVKKVEYYIDDNKEDIYLGKAKEKDVEVSDDNEINSEDKEEKEWELNIDQENRLPNGEYDVYAKIHTDNGDKESKRVKLRVEKKYADFEEQKEKLKKNFGELSPNVDSDGDGLSDADEERLGTNPYLADTDNDGYIDGDEIKNGFDPLKASKGNKSDKIVFESPKNKGTVRNEYKVEEVEMKKDSDGNKILLKGKALPNTFVRVYIYSNNPIIVTVRTDKDGNWSYELDKELKNGEHEVYVAVTDNTGKITSKSKPLAFVKTAEAVSVVPVANAKTTESPVENIKQYNIIYGVIITIAVFSIALVIIKLLLTHK